MSETKFNVAVVGATGVVGEAMLAILAEREFPVEEVYALASDRSVGKRVEFGERMIKVTDLAEFDFSQVDLALFATDATISQQYVPEATSAGAISIDTSSAFRYEDDIPLVVPEVNPDAVSDYTHRGIIASPNPLSVQLLLALKPIHDAVGVARINICTYQSVSGSGKQAIETLAFETASLMNAKSVKPGVYGKQIAFNVLGQVGELSSNGYTKEEMELVRDSAKILAEDSLQINPTAVRVPIFYGNAEAVHIETKDKISAVSARELWENAPGVKVMDEPGETGYPTPVSESSASDEVFIGRIREDISHLQGLNFWSVSDNVRRGAALNSVQIAEILVKNYL